MGLAASTAFAIGTTTVTVSQPAGGWVAGSTLVAICGNQGAGAIAPTCAALGAALETNSSTNLYSGIFALTLSGAGPASYTFTVATGLPGTVCILEYASLVASGVDVSAKATNTGSTITYPALTTGAANEIVALLAAGATLAVPGTPSGGVNTYALEISQTAFSAASEYSVAFDGQQTSAGAIGTVTGTNPSGGHWTAYSIALLPPAASFVPFDPPRLQIWI